MCKNNGLYTFCVYCSNKHLYLACKSYEEESVNKEDE